MKINKKSNINGCRNNPVMIMTRSCNQDIINVCNGNINPSTDVTIINQPNCFSQSRVLWAAKIVGSETHGAAPNGKITSSIIDSNNNTIFVGHFGSICGESNLTDPIIAYNSDGTIGKKLTPSCCIDGLVAKYNSLGFVIWVAKISGISNETAMHVTTDIHNNIIVSGIYNSPKVCIYDSCEKNATILPPSSDKISTFIVKYNPDGKFLWANVSVSSYHILINNITTDYINNIYTIGSYNGTNVNFLNADGSSGATLSQSLGIDIFLTKYSQNGNIQWATKIGGTGTDTGHSVKISSDGNIIIMGLYKSNNLLFYNTPNGSNESNITLSNNKGTNIFIAKYSDIGKAIWASKISNIYPDIAPSLVLDGHSNIIFSGTYHTDRVVFYNLSGENAIELSTDIHSASIHSNDDTRNNTINTNRHHAFIAKYNYSGVPLWAAKITGNEKNSPINLSIDSKNHILVSGTYDSPFITFYNANDTRGPLLSSGNIIEPLDKRSNSILTDSFIIEYNPDGRVLWATKQSGNSINRATTVTVDNLGGTIGTGIYFSPRLFLHNSDGSVGKILLNFSAANNIRKGLQRAGFLEQSTVPAEINPTLEKSNVYLVKYINYRQILYLHPPLAFEHTKTIILHGYHGYNTLILADIGILRSCDDRYLEGIILTDRGSQVTMQWIDNIWTIISADSTTILY